ncbi:glycyl-tRNA synthetase, beta subunit [Anaeromyxobacter dehalogenans 2CP-1]|uniref:Glycine--tRNA ligase beta subunit n=1 Tax=Anaeromyxobacter dehalogenans (strain ATCC BAA-258 / DSM 21875 / 2CP-1) TaxID=455488 RepID=SYGB_ANAD2|nr:glycine--tRNA ligase subunit beta [Anaeromyxobacter dehalogenans]B8JDD8.1 RecName: Full=Glycine--tRNA ligase beta subunit; AltName: Full=Glycyl-tRNA synthetase beta subunit; Short=GlyRS [Anaeromyxobacter dehalogenans 2CP-1]ACL65987.1 glycyl-tRNA synthetase, beta subunit [Anaeromyxobacter dehalogenans 2CP-1]
MADLLFEIGAEEIPAGFVPGALRQLEDDLSKALADARLAHGEVRSVGTPRRLAVWARDVAPKQTDARTEAFGPPVAQAYDAEGKPTPAATGFARSQGVEVSALVRAQTPKGERVAVTKVEKGRRAEQVLPALLERLVGGLRFRKAMRSRFDEATFARPVRWMVALLGGRPLKVRHGEVTSGKVTYGHRFLAPKAIALKGTPDDYLAKLRRAHVLADPVERRAALLAELARAGKEAAGKVRDDPALVEQVLYLVEEPTAVVGEFEKSNLELPPEVVISEMRNHQRYFAVVDGKGRLKNRFVAVSATRVKDPAVARHGYERVLRARLADARFFFEEDRKRRLHERIEDLGRRTFQAKLGSELDRAQRIGAVASALARALGKDALVADLLEASRLAKVDLNTGMVGEFPELQGTMGAHYARLEGLKPEIADAIEDHYKPIGAAEELPRSDLGALVAVADRLHSLVGIIGVGEKATGAADPFGLRRSAIGILRIVIARGYHLSLAAAVEQTLDALSGVKLAAGRAVVAEQVLDFLRGRVRAAWTERFDADLVEAVLAAGSDDVVDARRRLEALADAKARPDFGSLAVAFKRVANIQEKAGGSGAAAVDPALLRDAAEKDLLAALEKVEQEVVARRAARDYPAVLRTVATLEPAVARFFDGVLVMAEDPALRANRLGLMRRVAALFSDLADFRKIQAEAPAQARAG